MLLVNHSIECLSVGVSVAGTGVAVGGIGVGAGGCVIAATAVFVGGVSGGTVSHYTAIVARSQGAGEFEVWSGVSRHYRLTPLQNPLRPLPGKKWQWGWARGENQMRLDQGA